VLAGGKSGGHVFPLLAVGEELRRRGWRLVAIGAADSLEQRLARGNEIEFVELPAQPFLGRGPLARARALFVLLLSSLRARALLRRREVTVIVSSGGFVAAPAVVGGWLARRPILLIEPNARAGLANRSLSWLSCFAAVAHPRTQADLRCPSEVLGVPVRGAFWQVVPFTGSRVERLLVLGGSQGALRVNRALPRALLELRDLDLQVRHQTGSSLLEATREAYRACFEVAPDGRYRLGGVTVELLPFIDDMPAALAWSHLVVSRAGALTLAEIAATGRAAVLIPLAAAGGGHQIDNARTFEAESAGVVLQESELDRLADLLRELVAAPERVAELGRRARLLGRQEAAAAIADRVEQLWAGRRAA
jgi:UDP-N-acetylglucosamine--N-acetylmuramyl-(pentapeptide) pyrophosphoryl-undecaprenol N-acetylglucosamine transferase